MSDVETMLLQKHPRIWYVAIHGRLTLQEALKNLDSFVADYRANPFKSVIFDYRDQTHFPPPEDWHAYVDVVRCKLPASLQLVWILRDCSQQSFIGEIMNATRDAHSLGQVCGNWPAAMMVSGLPETTPDPYLTCKRARQKPKPVVSEPPAPAPVTQDTPDEGPDALMLE